VEQRGLLAAQVAVEWILGENPDPFLDSGGTNSRGGTSAFECKDRSSLQVACRKSTG
jgi:hypothetical protein